MNDGTPTEVERNEWLRWLVEDSLMLSSVEKLMLLEKLNDLKTEERNLLLEILLDEKRLLDHLLCA